MFESYCFWETACTLKEQESLGQKNKKHLVFITVLVKGYYSVEVLILPYSALTLKTQCLQLVLVAF